MSSSLKSAAHAGDIKAIESLMNKAFAAKGITVRVTHAGSTLKVSLRNASYPQQQLSDVVKRGISSIHPDGFTSVSIKSEQTDSTDSWQEQWNLDAPASLPEDQANAVLPVEQASKVSQTTTKWYQQTWVIILLIILMPILGVPLIWLSRWPKQVKIGASAAGACLLLFATVYSPDSTDGEQTDSEQITEQTQTATEGTNQLDTSVSESNTPEDAESTIIPESIAAPAFGDAVKAATKAAEATQSAQTTEQWTDVAALWQEAIDFMKDVPVSDPNYETAQVKAREYGSNLDYARTNISATQDAHKATSTSSESADSQSSEDRIFIGEGPTGYTLWLGTNGCIYVKDLMQSDLARLGVSLKEFKKIVKEETGSQCVFFE